RARGLTQRSGTDRCRQRAGRVVAVHRSKTLQTLMPARILDGKESARKVKAEVAASVDTLGYQPGLATVLVGDDPASHHYVKGKQSDAEEVGIRSVHHELPADVSQARLEQLIAELNDSDDVDGILVQLPLP